MVGLLAGALSVLLTEAVYGSEDFFRRLPIHWMWWPVLGGLAIGIGGLIFPQALGVGYDLIGDLLQRRVPPQPHPRHPAGEVGHLGRVSLGSGTSGGVLAPLLMIGGALGGIEAMFLPHVGPGFWPLVSMGAVLARHHARPVHRGDLLRRADRRPQDDGCRCCWPVAVAYGFTVLILRRSILTEKVARRGYHLSCEYAVDPMEAVFVREAMREPAGSAAKAEPEEPVAYPDEPLRLAVHRMAENDLTRLPVVESELTRDVVGTIALEDALRARSRLLDEEHAPRRPLGWRPGHRNGLGKSESNPRV